MEQRIMDKKTMDLMFSSKCQELETPQDFFDKLNEEFHFTLDPCCSEKTKKCSKYYTEKENGLIQDWGGRLFL
jgi:site-specific DNA-methyltransferase (adenine-specific)